jgi:Uma2 family endonuclease
MTTRPVKPQPDTSEIIQFPDAPPEEMTAFDHVNFPAYPAALAEHFGSPETTIIISEIAAALIPTRDYTGVRYPDLLIAFNVNPTARVERNGYLIPEQGKPPDFVLEVASNSTGRIDETVKRDAYAAMGVPEYWRYDPSGGLWHSTHVAGDRLVGGVYVPINIHRTDDEHLWGHSDALGLALCWEEGNLRFWDPVSQEYLTTYSEERTARLRAEARVRQLEEELHRRGYN